MADHAVRDDGSLGQGCGGGENWLDLTWSELGDGFGVGVGKRRLVVYMTSWVMELFSKIRSCG